MTAENDGSYSEICLVGITPKDGSAVQFASYIELDSIDPTEGDKDISTANMANGGRVVKKTPQADSEVTVKLYEIDIGASSSLAQHYHGGNDASAPLSVVNSHTRNLFQVAFLWTDDTAASSAEGTTASGEYARRLAFKDLRMTSYKESIEDSTLVVTATFKGPAFNQSNTGLVTRQSVTSEDATGLSELPAYT